MSHVTNNDDRVAVRDRLRGILINATVERPFRSGFGGTESGSEIEWVLHGRLEMLTAVNKVRADRGYPPVLIGEIERADRLAAGHVDWVDQFPLYCAEIALSPSGKLS